MNWIGVKGEFWPCSPLLLSYPLLYIRKLSTYSPRLLSTRQITTTIGVIQSSNYTIWKRSRSAGREDERTYTYSTDTITQHSLIHDTSFTVISRRTVFICTVVQIINHAHYLRFTSLLI